MHLPSQAEPNPVSAKISAGRYEIGCYNIPNASPVHSRDFGDFWIDCFPVTFAHFEKFVASGGYFSDQLWMDSDTNRSDRLPQQSVDQRCNELNSHVVSIHRMFKQDRLRSDEIPLVGLTWMEAAAVCRFFDARLPFEWEWEVAMKPQAVPGNNHSSDSVWNGCPVSRWGCVITVGTLQEWTAGPFTRRYWRAADENKPEFWSQQCRYGVSMRGAAKGDLHSDYRFRRSTPPDTASSQLGFRRLWETRPSHEQSTFSFVGVNS
ncbi:hypothetical protein CKO51_27215 [Rhodopirellula sp. SM50]|nr:hypothetical protein CKO51_27215 [Rhodopirellula sp. SM50]